MKKILLITILLAITYVNASNDFQKGLDYLNGKEGIYIVKKSVPNCEEDGDCIDKKLPANSMVTVNIRKKNYHKALYYLKKASQDGNVLAADTLVEFLLSKVNYKESKIFWYLRDVLKKDMDLTVVQYKKLLFNSMDIGAKKHGCKSTYFKAEFLSHGYLGYAKNIVKAKKLYKEAYRVCPKTTIYSILSKKHY